jgi:hypothetical protein
MDFLAKAQDLFATAELLIDPAGRPAGVRDSVVARANLAAMYFAGATAAAAIASAQDARTISGLQPREDT